MYFYTKPFKLHAKKPYKVAACNEYKHWIRDRLIVILEYAFHVTFKDK